MGMRLMAGTEVLLPTSVTEDDVDQASPQHAHRALLVGPDGEQMAVPDAIYTAFRKVLEALEHGQAVTISAHGTELTTQQAADMLGVSRPTLIRLLDSGEIRSSRPNKHRRIRLEDVEAYRARRRNDRLKGLAAMVEISEEMGLYDEDLPPIRR